jgi:anti-anti-sigma factor
MSDSSIPVVQPPRELTAETLAGFEAELVTQLRSPGPGIVLDLSDVEFISSAGLGLIVKYGMRLDAQDRRLAMARAARVVEKTIRLLGLDRKMPLYRSVGEATQFVAGAVLPG